MEQIPLAAQTMFAELVQRALDAEFDENYDERGRFKRRRKKGGYLYWHYVRDIDGKEKEEYVGPVRDPVINDTVKRFQSIKSDYKKRRQMVRALRAVGIPQADEMTGMVIEALWKAGFFRLRGVLVGTAAFQCYSGLLGVRMTGATLMTQDIDAAQFPDVSRFVGDTMPPILEVLHSVDRTFRSIPDLTHPSRVSRFVNDDRYLVEFITPNRGSDKNQRKPAVMPALDGASVTPLRYLDYLIYDPVRAVILYKGGIPVVVPSPERYAIHKLIIAPRRRENIAKSSKDIAQAEQLIRACLLRRSFNLFQAWDEAWQRGSNWKKLLKQGAEMLSEDVRNDFIFSMQSHGWAGRGLKVKSGVKLKKKSRTKRASKQSTKRRKKNSRLANQQKKLHFAISPPYMIPSQ